MANNEITIGVCTFRRQSLAYTLRSIASQRLDADEQICVLVVDNDKHDRRRSEIEALGLTLGLKLTYVHAPAFNISAARNACLDACKTRWLAFIDDDEEAAPDWLHTLRHDKSNANFTFGLCQAVYPENAPRWMVSSNIHSNQISRNDGAWNGYTSNVLIDVAFVHSNKLRFELDFGQTGGEDTMFFYEAHQLGASFSYNPRALVLEPVAASRLKFRWALKRKFRAGQVHFIVLKRQNAHRRGLMLAIVKALACYAMAPLTGKRWRETILRGTLHAGVVARALGSPVYAEYANVQTGSR